MTPQDLRQILPHCPPEWATALLEVMPRWDVNTPLREAAFLAQWAFETNEFTKTEENLSYSIAAMMRVWPKRFPSMDAAAPYEHQPEKLANYVYANRNGNGPPDSGDGWRYRGRGPQLTGRANYRAAGVAIGQPLEEEPHRVCRPMIGAEVAGWFWYGRALNDLADKQAFAAITQKINGGLTGEKEREAYYANAKKVLAL